MALSNEVKKIVLQEEMARWEQGLYQLQVRARVFKAIGDEAQYANAVTALEHQEKALDALQVEWRNLEIEDGAQ